MSAQERATGRERANGGRCSWFLPLKPAEAWARAGSLGRRRVFASCFWSASFFAACGQLQSRNAGGGGAWGCCRLQSAAQKRNEIRNICGRLQLAIIGVVKCLQSKYCKARLQLAGQGASRTRQIIESSPATAALPTSIRLISPPESLCVQLQLDAAPTRRHPRDGDSPAARAERGCL